MSIDTEPGELSSLLHRLYAGITDPTRAGEFFAACCKRVGAQTGAVAVCELPTRRWRYIDFYPGNPEGSQHYQEQYATHDPVVPALLAHPPRRFYTLRELVSEEQIRANPYFTEWHAQFGLEELCAARIPMADQYSLHVTFLRVRGAPPFGRRELDLLDLLLPHMEQAMALHNQVDRLTVLADMAQEYLAQSGTGIVLLTEDGRVTFVNRVAERTLTDPVFSQGGTGEIRLADPALQGRLEGLVNSCITLARRPGVMPGGVMSAPRTGAPPIGIMVLPYRNHTGLRTGLATASRAVLVIYDPLHPRLEPPAILRELYGLTDSEVQVCWRLVNGESVEEIAAAQAVSRETVRSQLKRVFTKTGTSRQAELVRLLLIGPALWAHIPSIMKMMPD